MRLLYTFYYLTITFVPYNNYKFRTAKHEIPANGDCVTHGKVVPLHAKKAKTHEKNEAL